MQPFIEAKREQIAKLCRTHHVRRLSIFGSAVRDDFDPAHSDVDVRIEFDREEIPSYLDNIYSLEDALVAMFGRKVDILSAREIENPYLRAEIESTQVTLYAA